MTAFLSVSSIGSPPWFGTDTADSWCLTLIVTLYEPTENLCYSITPAYWLPLVRVVRYNADTSHVPPSRHHQLPKFVVLPSRNLSARGDQDGGDHLLWPLAQTTAPSAATDPECTRRPGVLFRCADLQNRGGCPAPVAGDRRTLGTTSGPGAPSVDNLRQGGARRIAGRLAARTHGGRRAAGAA